MIIAARPGSVRQLAPRRTMDLAGNKFVEPGREIGYEFGIRPVRSAGGSAPAVNLPFFASNAPKAEPPLGQKEAFPYNEGASC